MAPRGRQPGTIVERHAAIWAIAPTRRPSTGWRFPTTPTSCTGGAVSSLRSSSASPGTAS